MVEHVGSVYNRFAPDNEDMTAYERIHGNPAEERAIEFGEIILFRVISIFIEFSVGSRWNFVMMQK